MKPDLYKSHDYRVFLRELIELGGNWSLRKLAKQMSISSGHFSDILNRRRQLSKKIYKKLMSALGLTKADSEFFWLLVEFVDGNNFKKRQAAFLKIKKNKAYKERHKEALVQHEYLSNWHYFAIRELTNTSDFKLDPIWIRKKLRYELTLEEIKNSLNFLFKNNFLKVDKTGKISDGGAHIRGEGDLLKLAVAHGHLGIMDLATQSIFKTPRELRHLLSHTTAFSGENMPQVKAILEDALEKIRKLEKASENKDVYNFSLYAFPLSEVEDVSK